MTHDMLCYALITEMGGKIFKLLCGSVETRPVWSCEWGLQSVYLKTLEFVEEKNVC